MCKTNTDNNNNVVQRAYAWFAKKSARERIRFTRHPEELRVVQRLKSGRGFQRPFRSVRVSCDARARDMRRPSASGTRVRALACVSGDGARTTFGNGRGTVVQYYCCA